VDRIGAVPLHARSLVPLVRARDFGMTPVLENFGDGFSLSFRAQKIVRFANDLHSRELALSDRPWNGGSRMESASLMRDDAAVAP